MGKDLHFGFGYDNYLSAFSFNLDNMIFNGNTPYVNSLPDFWEY